MTFKICNIYLDIFIHLYKFTVFSFHQSFVVRGSKVFQTNSFIIISDSDIYLLATWMHSQLAKYHTWRSF